jgi:hypothetical protein
VKEEEEFCSFVFNPIKDGDRFCFFIHSAMLNLSNKDLIFSGTDLLVDFCLNDQPCLQNGDEES